MLNRTKLVLLLLFTLPLLFYSMFTRADPAASTAYSATGRLAEIGSMSVDKAANKNEIPEKKPQEVVIAIDPGHGGEDPGTSYGDMYEKNINLDISLRLGALLKQAGIKTIYTREKDATVGLAERANMANDAGATLFISVHNNQMPDDREYKGTETLYCPAENPDPGKMDGAKLARIVQKELIGTLKTVDNGIIYRPNLAVLHRTKMPAVIAEVAYISNWSDRERLASKEFRQKAADALFRAVSKALNAMGAVKREDGKWFVTP
jgi:N-acetylmuramoyl-L-alanine amidase